MPDQVEGRVRESADGLRKRDPKVEEARMRETRQQVAQEAAAKREREKGEQQHGPIH